VLPGVIGLVQATEVVKLRRDPKCPLCGTAPTIKDLSIHGNGGGACEITSEHHAAVGVAPKAGG